jgi:subtilisin family serine protease
VGALNTKETAVRSDDTVCTFSSRGPTYLDHLPKPDLVAPGNKILSMSARDGMLELQYPGNVYDDGNDYFQLSGTSMAAPQVSGVVALMLQGNPRLNPNTVKAVLMYSAQKLALTDALGRPLAPGLSVLTQGAGSVNAVGAVEVARKIDTTRPVGSYWLTAALSQQSAISGQAFPCAGRCSGDRASCPGTTSWACARRSGATMPSGATRHSGVIRPSGETSTCSP